MLNNKVGSSLLLFDLIITLLVSYIYKLKSQNISILTKLPNTEYFILITINTYHFYASNYS